MIMEIMWPILIMLLSVFAMPVVADDVDRWIQDLKDPNPAVREAAVLAFIGHNDTRTVDPLIKALDDKDPRIQIYAAFALGKLNDTIQALDDDDWQVRWHAAEALGYLGDTRAVGPLIQILKDEEPLVRGSAALALGKLNDTRAVGPLVILLNDRSVVRLNAADALGELNDTRAVMPLVKASKGDDQHLREHAREAIRHICGLS